jgi:UDP-N-acetylmuramyl tripeptide synthase
MGEVSIHDSRRLTGPNLLHPRPGAIIDVSCPEELKDDLFASWTVEARRILSAVGWPGEELATRDFPGGASLFLTAPVDALYTATEVNEWALEAWRHRIEGGDPVDLEESAAKLRRWIEEERKPALMALRDAAAAHGVQFLMDHEAVSVGLGAGALVFPIDGIPAPGEIDWPAVHDVPLALVTGTNGKSTTVRLLAAMAGTAGHTPGYSSSDGVRVGDEFVLRGDYSGPEGARRTLRDPGVTFAVLETARGGLLRRGLPVDRADAAVVTNVTEDHLGEWGVGDLASLTRAKLVIGRAIGADGLLVLNADDPELVREGGNLGVPTAWFSLFPPAPGRSGAWLEGDVLTLPAGPVIGVGEIPITLCGAARYNVANALAALLAGAKLGLPREAMARGLAGFTGSPDENPGRGNRFDIGGAIAILDYAHNPGGFRALFEMSAAIPARRRLVLLGQAGDRSDSAIRDLARIAWETRPDRIIVKEMRALLRGRDEGEVPAIIENELKRLGAPAEAVVRAASDLAAVEAALAWSEPGDLLLLLVHTERQEVLTLLAERARGTA